MTSTPVEVTIVRPKALFQPWLAGFLANLITAWAIMLVLPIVDPSLAFSYIQVFLGLVILKAIFQDSSYIWWSKTSI